MRAQLKTILAKRKVLIPTIAVATALVLAFLIFVSRSNKPAEAATRPIDVQVVKVEQKDVPVYNEWIGTTEGMVNADIRPQVSGYLLRQDYKEGSFVKKGQLLFEIDPRPFQAALDQAQGQVAQFQGQLEQVSSQVKQAEAQVAQSNSQILQAQAQVGNLVNTQSAALTTVSTVDPIKIYFTLSEQQYLYFNKAGLINARSGASVAQIELELILADGSTFPQKGNFYFADRQVDQKTGAIRMAGLFSNPGDGVRPGEDERVRAGTAPKNDAVLGPH